MKNIIIEGDNYTISNNDFAKIQLTFSGTDTGTSWDELLDYIRIHYKINKRLKIDGIYNY
jgi:hypothetical protein